jgi:uncharacterized protein with HEPN domain
VPPREWRFRIQDILDSLARIQEYTLGMSYEDFASDERTLDAVIRHLGIIGEASNHIPEDIRSAEKEVPWGPMRAMRNFVVHEYFGTSKQIVWKTLTMDLPPLEGLLRDLLERHPA